MINTIPKHVAIIMDGNGRWAKSNSKTRLLGHKKGVETVRKVIDFSKEIGVQSLTLYTFSKDNWKRPKNEVLGLMDLLYITLKKELHNFVKNDLKVTYIGDISSFPDKVINIISETVETTMNNKTLNLNLALGYSGRSQIVDGARKIADKVLNKEIDLDDINVSLFSDILDCGLEIGDPDLLIRTGKEFRVSDFLLWQIAYTEIYFSDKYWPDFDEEEYMKAISYFKNTERRYGKISEQVK